ncbi:MAG: manganese efflux pump, partial [Nitrospirae bacterium]|nr:manganese efflux pump [Nitrospirota bacterium]
PVVIIGIVTFIFSFIGVFLGRRLGELFGKRVEILGGLILIGIGIKIII